MNTGGSKDIFRKIKYILVQNLLIKTEKYFIAKKQKGVRRYFIQRKKKIKYFT